MTRLQSNRQSDGPGTGAWIAIGALCMFGMIGVVVLAAWRIGVTVSSEQEAGWTSTATVITIAGTLLILALTAIVVWAVSRGQKGVTRVDYAAKYLGNRHKRDLQPFTEEAVAKQAARLHASAAGPGVPLGEPVRPR
ncbi:MAG: hypothetical protein L0K12_00880 [Brevibacterium aurantiacum]|uniref:hypothetical protein n=1 Tax=Brachybacterium alimentarium TaxID=47845 RepID=UPI0011C04D9A|nr:hypothetical protein [Brachybacterium alimentarium]MDN6301724.1 hypothetical protein [Brachybacterium sp.]MDN6371475.1 hypothetical protein [Brevibacterium aurantiacum]